ncbi:MAG: hypothetical protein NZ879_00525 [Archaeoglobaceae archaeon]|nr:hypothetical protein [Archaeoglobaceae archaeon]MDW8117452.1 hypothetical protein [Archaeoglobaceae archaeon]
MAETLGSLQIALATRRLAMIQTAMEFAIAGLIALAYLMRSKS